MDRSCASLPTGAPAPTARRKGSAPIRPDTDARPCGVAVDSAGGAGELAPGPRRRSQGEASADEPRRAHGGSCRSDATRTRRLPRPRRADEAPAWDLQAGAAHPPGRRPPRTWSHDGTPTPTACTPRRHGPVPEPGPDLEEAADRPAVQGLGAAVRAGGTIWEAGRAAGSVPLEPAGGRGAGDADLPPRGRPAAAATHRPRPVGRWTSRSRPNGVRVAVRFVMGAS